MLKGKTALVTGSTSGIGLGIARAADWACCAEAAAGRHGHGGLRRGHGTGDQYGDAITPGISGGHGALTVRIGGLDAPGGAEAGQACG